MPKKKNSILLNTEEDVSDTIISVDQNTYSFPYILPALVSASLLLTGCSEDGGDQISDPAPVALTVPYTSQSPAPVVTPTPAVISTSPVVPPRSSATPVVDNKAVANTPFFMAGAIASNSENNFNIAPNNPQNAVGTDWLLNRFKSDNLNSAVLHFNYNLDINTDTFSRPNFNTSDLYLGAPTWDTIDAGGAKAASLGLKPVFYMTVLSLPNSWNSLLADNYVPKDPDAFFASYKDALVNVAKLSEKYDSPYMNIGTELGPVATDSKYLPYWDDIISTVRQIYHGKLTYSSYVDDTNNYNTELTSVTFKDKLDMLGMNIYPQTLDHGELNGTYDQFYNEWKTNIVPSLNGLIDNLKMPTFISEFGISRLDGSGSGGFWGNDAGKTYDYQEQADLFDAALRAIHEGLNISGIVLWGATDSSSTSNGMMDPSNSYTNNWVDVPAESIIQKWADKFLPDIGGGATNTATNVTAPALPSEPPVQSFMQKMTDLFTPDFAYSGGGGGGYSYPSVEVIDQAPTKNWYDDIYGYGAVL